MPLNFVSGSVLLGQPVSPAVGNPCAKQCRLQVFPDMDDGSACQDCAADHLGYWRYNRFASIDLLWGKAYSQDSVLMGTTQSHINSIVEAILRSEGFNVRLWVPCWPCSVVHSFVGDRHPLMTRCLGPGGQQFDCSQPTGGQQVSPIATCATALFPAPPMSHCPRCSWAAVHQPEDFPPEKWARHV